VNAPFFIARRYLISRKTNNAINIISWISVFAVAVGTAALIIILSFMNGLTGLVKDLYNSFDADIEITAVQGKTFRPDSLQMIRLGEIDGVRFIDFSVEDNALIKYGDKQSFAVVKGVGDDFFKMTALEGQIEDGSPILKASDGNYIVLGKGINYQLGINIHNKFIPVQLFSPKKGNAAVFTQEEGLLEEQVIPGGYFTINDEFDYKYVLVHREVAQRLFDCENEVSAIEVAFETAASPEETKKAIQQVMGKGFNVKDRYEQNKTLFSTLQSEKLIVFIVLVFILLVATFNIIGSLIMLMMEKKNDMRTLLNLGADEIFIRKIFHAEGMLIVLAGATSGLILGLAFCFLHLQFGIITMQALGREIPYPMNILFSDFLLIFLVVLTIGWIAAWFPVKFFIRKIHPRTEAIV
jgi:lipoprotein-releasing system permease protein